MPFVVRRGTGHIEKEAFGNMEDRWSADWEAFKDSPDREFTDTEHYEVLQSRGLMPEKGGRILEGGCGYAHWVRSLHDMGYDVVGLDYAQSAIDLSKERWPHLELVQGDLRDMPFKDDEFDLIISLGAIEHDINGPEAALAELRRVLKPGGVMHCSVPCISGYRRLGALPVREFLVNNPTFRRLTGRHPTTEFYEYNYTISEYRKLLEDNGFEVIEMVPLHFHTRLARGPIKPLIKAVHELRPSFFAHMITGLVRKK